MAQSNIASLLEDNNDWFINAIYEWHTAHVSNFKEIGKNFELLKRGFYKFDIDSKGFFNFVAQKIDLPLEL